MCRMNSGNGYGAAGAAIGGGHSDDGDVDIPYLRLLTHDVSRFKMRSLWKPEKHKNQQRDEAEWGRMGNKASFRPR